MSEDYTFDFEKFTKDIDKRSEEHRERSTVQQFIIDEDTRRRRRNELYNERWQNQITWESK